MEQFCSEEGCCRSAAARGFCDLHYRRWRLARASPCVVDGCEKPGGFPGGMCQKHYVRKRRHGDPHVVKHSSDGHVDPGCSAAACDGRHYAKGFCKRHYRKAFPERCPNPKWSAQRRAAYQKRRAQKKTGHVGEPVSLDEIQKRDNGRCGLCGGRVNGKPWPHPLSASLDHIVPLSEGGAHSAANVQLAHLRCNVQKGVRGCGTQLRLI